MVVDVWCKGVGCQHHSRLARGVATAGCRHCIMMNMQREGNTAGALRNGVCCKHKGVCNAVLLVANIGREAGAH